MTHLLVIKCCHNHLIDNQGPYQYDSSNKSWCPCVGYNHPTRIYFLLRNLISINRHSMSPGKGCHRLYIITALRHVYCDLFYKDLSLLYCKLARWKKNIDFSFGQKKNIKLIIQQ